MTLPAICDVFRPKFMVIETNEGEKISLTRKVILVLLIDPNSRERVLVLLLHTFTCISLISV